jgi:hypothetical protein
MRRQGLLVTNHIVVNAKPLYFLIHATKYLRRYPGILRSRLAASTILTRRILQPSTLPPKSVAQHACH